MNMEYPVTICSNKTLYGIYHKSKHNQTAIITLHGLGGTRIDVHRICVLFARELVKHDISCLRFDLTGSGVSQGNFVDFTFEQQYVDAINTIEWLKKQERIKKIFLLGFSDGAITAYHTGISNDDIKGMIFWSPNFITNKEDKILDSKNIFNNRLHRVEKGLAWPILGHWVYKDYFEDRNNLINSLNFSLLDKKCIALYGSQDIAIKHTIENIHSDFLEKKEIEAADHLYFSPVWTNHLIESTIEWILNNK